MQAPVATSGTSTAADYESHLSLGSAEETSANGELLTLSASDCAQSGSLNETLSSYNITVTVTCIGHMATADLDSDAVWDRVEFACAQYFGNRSGFMTPTRM
jgi:hypothetical protein